MHAPAIFNAQGRGGVVGGGGCSVANRSLLSVCLSVRSKNGFCFCSISLKRLVYWIHILYTYI